MWKEAADRVPCRTHVSRIDPTDSRFKITRKSYGGYLLSRHAGVTSCPEFPQNV